MFYSSFEWYGGMGTCHDLLDEERRMMLGVTEMITSEHFSFLPNIERTIFVISVR
jgi:DNA replication initiation complex subunit (GINS family)